MSAVTAHEDEVEALRLLVELLESADDNAVAVRIACDPLDPRAAVEVVVRGAESMVLLRLACEMRVTTPGS